MPNTILIVDDEINSRKVLKERLTEQGSEFGASLSDFCGCNFSLDTSKF